jgi:hypothetical protein
VRAQFGFAMLFSAGGPEIHPYRIHPPGNRATGTRFEADGLYLKLKINML